MALCEGKIESLQDLRESVLSTCFYLLGHSHNRAAIHLVKTRDIGKELQALYSVSLRRQIYIQALTLL